MASSSCPSRLNGLAALVTGGSRGLGLLLCARLALRGCRVTMAARDAEELRRGAEWVKEQTGATVHTAVCDVRDRGAVDSTISQTVEREGSLDIVIADAGVIQVAPAEAIDSAAFDAQSASCALWSGDGPAWSSPLQPVRLRWRMASLR